MVGCHRRMKDDELNEFIVFKTIQTMNMNIWKQWEMKRWGTQRIYGYITRQWLSAKIVLIFEGSSYYLMVRLFSLHFFVYLWGKTCTNRRFRSYIISYWLRPRRNEKERNVLKKQIKPKIHWLCHCKISASKYNAILEDVGNTEMVGY